MAKVRINKLPEGYKIDNGKLVENKHKGGTIRSGDQYNYGLITHPDNYPMSTTHHNPFSEVNSSLKRVPRDEATIEAEGGETALTDLNEDGKFELYNIVGPRHSSGGVPLNLPPQSFIYSDTREMLFNKDEMLEMGIESNKKLSPAAISKKFPLNKYIGVMDDITSDKIAIDTAEYMGDKNKKKLSQLAFIQEAKKGFDEGVPTAAYPYLKLQGIDPIEYTQKIEGISEKEAKAKALAKMPLNQREQIMQLQAILQEVQQQEQQPQGMPPQAAAQQMPPQGMPIPPQQQMMPPQGMMPPQQEMVAPPMAQPAMPVMRYGGSLPIAQEGQGIDTQAYADTLNAYIYQQLPQHDLEYKRYGWNVGQRLKDEGTALVLNADPELTLNDTIDTLRESNRVLDNPELAAESFYRAMTALGIEPPTIKPEGMSEDEFNMQKANQFFKFYGIDPNNLSWAVKDGLMTALVEMAEKKEEEEKRFGGDLPEAFWGKAMDYMQGGLSAVGMIPGIGNIADAANTAISGGRAAYSKYKGDDDAYKKHMGAMALNATAMIPGVGQMATMAKGAKGAKNVATAIGKESLKKTQKLAGDTIGQTVSNVADAYKHKGAQAFGDASIKGIGDANKPIGAAAQTVNLGKKATTVTDATGATDIQKDVKKQIGQTITGSPDASQLVDSPVPTLNPELEEKPDVVQYGGDPYSLDDFATQDEREAILHNAGIGEIYTLGTDELGDVPRMNLPPARSMKKRFLRSLDALDGYVGEKSGFNPDGPDIGYYGPLTAKGLSAEHKGNIPEDEIPYGVFKMNPYESMIRKKTGGDPFAPNPLRDFIYGGIAQDGKEIPEGMSEDAFDKAVKDGFTWDAETKTWTHPTYDQGYTNTMIDYYTKGYDVSGVTEGIGEEGIPDMQKKGTTESGATTYQGVSDEQVAMWTNANQYIIDGIKDENGNPMFTEENPFKPTPENVKLVQQGKNDYLDRLAETDPTIKEKYTKDGEFDKNAFYKDYHGYYGDGAQALDGKLGEYTVTDLGQQKKPDDPIEVNLVQPEEPEPEPVEELEETVEIDRPEFWLQDQIKYTDLVRQKLGLRKYRPWAATFSPETIDATYVDPGRAIAAIQEQANNVGDSSVFAGPAANRAMKLKAAGQGMRSISDVWAQNQEANLRSEAETKKINTLIKNEAAEKNADIKTTLYKDNIAVDKEYDNSLRDINNKLANQLANSYTNMMNTENLNDLYPQFDIDQGSGGRVTFTNPQELFANKNVDDRTKTERLADTIAELKKNNIDPKTLPKDVWSDLLADSTDDGNSELDEVKAAITQGGYNSSTGVLGGYPGGNDEQAKYGAEKTKRLAMKGRELKKWFSPLQGGLAD